MSNKPWRIGDAGTAVFEAKDPNRVSPKYIASGLSREDARLIAYAPEMAEVLQEFIDMMYDPTQTDCITRIADMAENVLAKVKGQVHV